MKNLTIQNIAQAVGGEIFGEIRDDQVDMTAACVCIDSRQIVPNGVFIATVGERVDGHSFIDGVFEKGALAVICEKVPENSKGVCIKVEDSFVALKKVAAFYRNQLNAKVVGITGSVGKTSTKEFVASVLDTHYNVWKTAGNFNNEVGMPLTILGASEDTEVLVLEMGINHFEEMDRLSAIARPDVMVITNIGVCHLEFLGDRDGVFKAKTECFNNLNEGATVVLNGDDDKLCRVDKVAGKSPLFFSRMSDDKMTEMELSEGAKKPAYVLKEAISKGLLGSKVKLTSVTGMEIEAEIPLPGEHMISNALAAMAVGDTLGLTETEIIAGIEKVQATGGRSNIINTGKLVLIDDCYNANPVSMKSAVDLLATADTRKVAVLGDMFELGEDEHALHRQVGEYVANSSVDLVIAVGQLSRDLYMGCESKAVYCENLEEAIQRIPELLKDGDSVLIKASHGMQFSKLVEMLKN